MQGAVLALIVRQQNTNLFDPKQAAAPSDNPSGTLPGDVLRKAPLYRGTSADFSSPDAYGALAGPLQDTGVSGGSEQDTGVPSGSEAADGRYPCTEVPGGSEATDGRYPYTGVPGGFEADRPPPTPRGGSKFMWGEAVGRLASTSRSAPPPLGPP